MKVYIRQDALELLFKVLLSCRCPLTSKQEKAIFVQFKKMKNSKLLLYEKLLKIFDENDSTVFHRLADFTIWSARMNNDKLIIERENVLRHFASSYHWDHVVGQNMDHSYRKVISVPKWFIGHMLLPVEIVVTTKNSIKASYNFKEGQIELKNLFIPPEFDISSTKSWAVHFASVLTPLSTNEESLIHTLIDMNPLFVCCRKEITEIDYMNFERFGNYTATGKKRYRKYFAH